MFTTLPGWSESDARPALSAFRRSCATFANEPQMHALGGAGYAGAVSDWDGVCAAVPGGTVGEDGARRYFESWFVPFTVSAGENADALFTGYYEPGAPREPPSPGRRLGYTTPIYGVPDDMVTADLGLFRDDLKGQHVTGRVVGHTFMPYFARAQIDARLMACRARPCCFTRTYPTQVFFLHIQGSGRARLDSGAFVRLAYAGQNGRPYTPVGRVLIQQGRD